MVGDQREAAIYRTTTKGLESVYRCVYAVYYVCIPLLGPPPPTRRQHHKPGAAPTGGASATSNTSEVTDVSHLFILCFNLLTCFFVFLSVLSALHETDGGIYIFHVFLYLVLSKLS